MEISHPWTHISGLRLQILFFTCCLLLSAVSASPSRIPIPAKLPETAASWRQRLPIRQVNRDRYFLPRQQEMTHHYRPLPPPPPADEGHEIDPRYGVEKRLVPSGPNPLHN